MLQVCLYCIYAIRLYIHMGKRQPSVNLYPDVNFSCERPLLHIHSLLSLLAMRGHLLTKCTFSFMLTLLGSVAKSGPRVSVWRYIFGVPHDSYCMLSYLLHMCIIESDWSVKCTQVILWLQAKGIRNISWVLSVFFFFFFFLSTVLRPFNSSMG